jgi:monoamine oxidase
MLAVVMEIAVLCIKFALMSSGEIKMPRVVVVGGGLAGLSAAYELMESGCDVMLLEAQTHPGGKIRTIRDPFPDGVAAELGAAAFIPVEPDALMRYIRKFSLPLNKREPRVLPVVYCFGGRRMVEARDGIQSWLLGLSDEERQLGIGGMRTKYLKPAVTEILDALRAGPAAAALFEKYDRISFADFMNANGSSPDATALLSILDWDMVGEDLRERSALDVLAQMAAYSCFTDVRYSIQGGNDLLPKAFASELGHRIRYGCVVNSIEHGQTGVTVSYNHASIPTTIAADQLVVALPLGRLAAIRFDPPLSAEKRNAIHETRCASVARIFLQCRRRFWIDEGLSGYAFTDLPITFMWDGAPAHRSGRGILQCFMTGERARQFATMDDERRLTLTLETVQQVFPAIRENFEAAVFKTWDEDAYSLGAYAYYRPGQITALLPHLKRAEGQIHFAGEHLSPLLFRGLAQGAIESGLDAAREIVGSAHLASS